MKTIKTEIIINAPQEEVWKVLTDLPSYPEWNPFIKRASGTLKLGGKLKIEIQQSSGNGMKFSPTITELEEGKSLVWLGKFLMRGIFDGEHFFRLESVGANKTVLIHGENFSGFLPAFMNDTLTSTAVGFEKMNQAIKKRVESF